MRVDPARQAQTLLLAALLGLAAGLVYDLLRPPRRRLRGPAALLPDALFCLLVGAACVLSFPSIRSPPGKSYADKGADRTGGTSEKLGVGSEECGVRS